MEAYIKLMIKMILALFALLGIGKEKDEKKNKDDKKNATIESANVESPDNTVKNAPKFTAKNSQPGSKSKMGGVDEQFTDLKGQAGPKSPGDEFQHTFSPRFTGFKAYASPPPPKPNAAPKPSPQAAASKADDSVTKCADFIKEKDLQKQLGDFLKDPFSDDGKRGYRQLALATHSDKTREMGEAERQTAENIFKQVDSYKRGFVPEGAAESGKQPADAKSEKKETNKGGLSSNLKDSDFDRGDKAAFKEASSFLSSVNNKIESDQKLGNSDNQHTTHKTQSPSMKK